MLPLAQQPGRAADVHGVEVPGTRPPHCSHAALHGLHWEKLFEKYTHSTGNLAREKAHAGRMSARGSRNAGGAETRTSSWQQYGPLQAVSADPASMPPHWAY